MKIFSFIANTFINANTQPKASLRLKVLAKDTFEKKSVSFCGEKSLSQDGANKPLTEEEKEELRNYLTGLKVPITRNSTDNCSADQYDDDDNLNILNITNAYSKKEITKLTELAKTQADKDAIVFLAGLTYCKESGDIYNRFNGEGIAELAKFAKKEEEQETIKYLANMINKDYPVFATSEIKKVLEKKEKMKALKIIIDCQKNCEPLIEDDYLNIGAIIRGIQNEDSLNSLEYLIKAKDENGDSIFTIEEIRRLLYIEDVNTPEGLESIKFLGGIKIDGKKPDFRGSTMAELIKKAKTPEGRDSIKFLAETGFNQEDILLLSGAAQDKKVREGIIERVKPDEKGKVKYNAEQILTDIHIAKLEALKKNENLQECPEIIVIADRMISYLTNMGTSSSAGEMIAQLESLQNPKSFRICKNMLSILKDVPLSLETKKAREDLQQNSLWISSQQTPLKTGSCAESKSSAGSAAALSSNTSILSIFNSSESDEAKKYDWPLIKAIWEFVTGTEIFSGLEKMSCEEEKLLYYLMGQRKNVGTDDEVQKYNPALVGKLLRSLNTSQKIQLLQEIENLKIDNKDMFDGSATAKLLEHFDSAQDPVFKGIVGILQKHGSYNVSDTTIDKLFQLIKEEEQLALSLLEKTLNLDEHLTVQDALDLVWLVSFDDEQIMLKIKELLKYNISGKAIKDLVLPINDNPKMESFLSLILCSGYIDPRNFDAINFIKLLPHLENLDLENLKKDSLLKIITAFCYDKFKGESVYLDIDTERPASVLKSFMKKYDEDSSFKEACTNFVNAISKEFISGEHVFWLKDQNADQINKAVALCKKYNSFLAPVVLDAIIDDGYLKLNFLKKNEALQELKLLMESKKNIELKTQLEKIEKSLTHAIEPVSVDRKEISKFCKTFLKRNIKTDSVLSLPEKWDEIAEKYGETGLPLEYSRKAFVGDLTEILRNLPDGEQKEILRKMDIYLNLKGQDDYEGFVTLSKLNRENPNEEAIYKIGEKFLKENQIKTGDDKIDKLLNTTIKAFPEFINIIGKAHHGPHKYTIDIHTLKVFKEVVSHPKFNELSLQDKIIAQFVALFHDIGKKGGEDDNYHEILSSIIANDILSSKVPMADNVRKRIVELIRNHNWSESMNARNMTAEKAAVLFRNPKDDLIMEIFAEADLKGVSESFYNDNKDSVQRSIENIRKKLQEFNAGGNMLFTTYVNRSKKLPEYDGNKVLDLTKVEDDANLCDYGLSTRNKEDLRFLVHATDEEGMEKLDKICHGIDDPVLCSTLISPSKHSLYNQSAKWAIMLDAPNSNIANSAPANQSSGGGKGLSKFVKFVFEDKEYRNFQRNVFLRALRKYYPNITQEQYGEIYKKLVNKKRLENFEDIILSDGTEITAPKLQEAYKAIEEAIIETTDKEHNEINVYNPKVAGIISFVHLESLRSDVLNFVQEHNLPIIILDD